MSRFTVVRLERASNQLAEIWMQADDRAAVSEAANTIDVELANDPGSKGQELAEGLRRLRLPPLQIVFALKDADRVVEVARVRAV